MDYFSAWDCGLCKFPTMLDIPAPFVKKWGKAMASVPRKVLLSETEEQTDQALKWFLALPQVLIREPRRGGRKG